MSDLYTTLSTRVTDQGSQADPRQVQNQAGGYTFQVDAVQGLRRFLMLGTTAGTYYASPKTHTDETFQRLRGYLDELGSGFVDEVVAVSVGGRAKSNDEALLALALAAANPATSRQALDVLPQVARTGTHLFTFDAYVTQFRGMGRALRNAIARWYTNRSPESLATQLVKYQSRRIGGKAYSHRNLIRLTRPQPQSDAQRAALGWAVGKVEGPVGLKAIDGYQAAHAAAAADDYVDGRVAAAIHEYQLSHEMVPSETLGSKHTWGALLPYMGMTAMIRNLGRMTSLGVFDDPDLRAHVLEGLTNQAGLQKARIHPMTVLVAMGAYKQGQSRHLTWTPDVKIIDALDEAFRLTFQNVTPTGKRRLIALDVSGSMGYGFIAGTNISAREASAAMALITLATEQNVDVVAFTSRGDNWRHGPNLVPLTISARQRLDDVIRSVSDLPFGDTDCAAPMLWALGHGKQYDSFEVYTDNETWAGSIHPHQALVQYRQKTGIDAKLIVVGMTATDFTIADPTDPGMLDVVGFDTAAPALMSEFIAGTL